jgi:hypothetical protein
MGHLCIHQQGSKSNAKREKCSRNVMANHLSGFSMTVQFEEPGATKFPKIVRYSDVTYTIPPDTLLMLHASVSSAFTPARLAIVAEPDEVLGRSGLPIRKAAA